MFTPLMAACASSLPKKGSDKGGSQTKQEEQDKEGQQHFGILEAKYVYIYIYILIYIYFGILEARYLSATPKVSNPL